MDRVLHYFSNNKISHCGTSSDNPLSFPFELTPDDFLDFAIDDQKEISKRGLVNTLANTKKIIECRIDQLLFLFGLFNSSKDKSRGFPKKTEILSELGVIEPFIFNKINSKRNKTEHNYNIPNKEEVEDFLEIAKLFLRYTNRFVNRTYIDFELEGEKTFTKRPHALFPSLSFKLYSDKSLFIGSYALNPEDGDTFKVSIKDREKYFALLKIFTSAILS